MQGALLLSKLEIGGGPSRDLGGMKSQIDPGNGGQFCSSFVHKQWTLDPRVVSSNPGLSVTRACVPGQNTLPLIARVFSDTTRKIVGPGSKRPHSGYINVICSGLTHSSISWWHWLWASCAHHRLRSAVLHDTTIGAAVRLCTCV